MKRIYTKRVPAREPWAWGLLFNEHAWWVGVHYSAYTRRFCINLLPCITVWVALPGGKTP